MIRFACPSCQATFTVGDDKAGKTTNCPKCKSQFIIPGDPPPAPKPAAVAKRAKPVVDDFEVIEEDEPPRRPRREDDDRPRSRSRRDVDDDEDDRPRRRSRRDDEDDYDDEPRPKKKKKARTSGMLLACGIVSIVAAIAMGGIAIHDVNQIRYSVGFSSTGMNRGMRDLLPPEVRSALDQIEIALIFYQVAIYAALVAALVYIAGGIGLILHQVFGRITTLVGMGISGLIILCMVVFIILIATISLKGSSGSAPWGMTILRIAVQAVPLIFAGITLFNIAHTRFLRSKL